MNYAWLLLGTVSLFYCLRACFKAYVMVRISGARAA